MRALAYLRTSSLANVDGDSTSRQFDAIDRQATFMGHEIVASFFDGGISGTMAAQDRPAFAAMLEHIEANDIRVVIIESSDRLARDLMASELAIVILIERGVKLYDGSGNELTDGSDPLKKMMRQICGAFAEYEKRRLVAKLHGARKRKALAGGYIGGLKPVSMTNPAAAELARSLKADGLSLRKIAAKLAEAGHRASSGAPYQPGVVAKLAA